MVDKWADKRSELYEHLEHGDTADNDESFCQPATIDEQECNDMPDMDLT